jgi:predicted dehydrogenase
MADIRIALAGAGAVGRTHLTSARATPGLTIAWVVDPDPATQALAAEFGAAWLPDARALLERERPDGAIVAVPNALHVPVALEFLAARVAVLVEKPIAETVESARRLSDAARHAGTALLVGHHRRYNPILVKARDLVRDGVLGRLVSIGAMAAVFKPDVYFEKPWRSAPGGGPVLINLIHEIDQLRFICGEIESVQAATSNKVRRLAIEDSAAVLIRFERGALATIALSDCAVSPWSWDLASGENASLPRLSADHCFISGTEGALSLPSLQLWRYEGERDLKRPMTPRTIAVAHRDPYTEQMHHFARVIRGEEQPAVTDEDATRTLAATLAVHESAKSGRVVRVATSF